MLTFQVLDAWIADICLSACFCLPNAFNLFGFSIKIVEPDKEVSGKMLRPCEINETSGETDAMQILKLLETLFWIDVLQQKYFDLRIVMTY